MAEPTVLEAMSRHRPSVDTGRPLGQALEEMKRAGLRTIPVSDGEGGVSGVLVWRDADAALREGGAGRTVADTFRKGIAIAADDSVAAAEALLQAHQVGLLPVIDGARHVGVITRSHIRTARDVRRRREQLEELRPPKKLLHRYNDSAEKFFETAQSGVDSLKHFGLEPHHAVLDPGCGVGRLAIALTQFLDDKGRYEGFDLFRDCIDWCASTITPRYPNFGFTHANIQVRFDNPGGWIRAEEYEFPYGDSEFDFVVLISVFTHMLAGGFERYLSEIARVLKPGGRVWATFMLLNETTVEQIATYRGPHQPVHDCGVCRVAVPEYPEDTVAFPEHYVRGAFDRLGLEIVEVTRGDWATKDHPGMGMQDGVLASLVHG